MQREIKARIDGEPVPDVLCCEDGGVHTATASTDDGFNLSALDSIPSSISIHDEAPADEVLYRENLRRPGDRRRGFRGGRGERLRRGVRAPEVVGIRSFDYVDGRLESITYEHDGTPQTLPLQELLDRIAEVVVEAPLVILQRPGGSSLHLPNGRLATVCLRPSRIRRKKTIIQEFEFGNGARVLVPDAVALQDTAVIVLRGYQLIHPRNSKPYFRAPTNSTTDDNLETLPAFA